MGKKENLWQGHKPYDIPGVARADGVCICKGCELIRSMNGKKHTSQEYWLLKRLKNKRDDLYHKKRDILISEARARKYQTKIE